MSAQWQPGQLLFTGFSGVELPDDIAGLIAAGRIGGVVLFGQNVGEPEQLRRLTDALHACAPDDAPLLIAIDQEGGRVQRLRKPWTDWPPMRRVGDADDPELTGSVARALALELLDLGIGLDFAPCVDVDTNPDNPVIGDRSFGRDPERVSVHTGHFVRAMQAAGVAACAKHFPGHGDTSTDSHFELPRIDHDLERLRAVELPPFAAAIEAGVATVMTAHVSIPAIDSVRPATLSPDVLAILREEFGFDGVVFTDDLEMKAIADGYGPKALVDGSLEAGVDALIVRGDVDLREQILQNLEHAADARLEHPLRRIIELKQRYAGPRETDPEQRAAVSSPPYPDHRALAARLA
jgi:beta-N-acetylhexosaminidase